MYCINCGVKLADTEKRCPLCGTLVCHPELVRPEAERLYPEGRYPASRVSHRSALIVLSTMFLLPALICLLCDLKLNGQLNWAGFVIGALALGYLIVVLPLWFRKPNPIIFVPCDFARLADKIAVPGGADGNRRGKRSGAGMIEPVNAFICKFNWNAKARFLNKPALDLV